MWLRELNPVLCGNLEGWDVEGYSRVIQEGASFLKEGDSGRGFPGGSVGKESACNAGDPGLVPGLGRSPVKGNGYPLQYSCLENPINRGAWQAPWGRKSQLRLSD